MTITSREDAKTLPSNVGDCVIPVAPLAGEMIDGLLTTLVPTATTNVVGFPSLMMVKAICGCVDGKGHSMQLSRMNVVSTPLECQ